MITITGRNYQNSGRSPAGSPIPEIIRLVVDGYKHEPLWYHKRNLMQTATGYGGRIVTEHMICIGKRWHRVYCACFSNSGTNYIIKNGKHIVIDLDDVVC